MSTQFAIDPSLASNSPDAEPPTTASPANLTKTPAPPSAQNVSPPPTSPPKQQNPSPGYYSILPALPPLPGWGPFPGPMFAPPPTGAMMPMPVYMAPPAHGVQPAPNGTDQWPTVSVPPSQAPAQEQAPTQPPRSSNNYYQKPVTTAETSVEKPQQDTPTQPRQRRPDPPMINPAAASSPHYQNPGGLGGVYAPPTTSDTTPAQETPTTTSHYAHTKSSSALTTITSSGRQFACGEAGCNAAFDRKSDCERHRRTHAKSSADARPFRCTRPGCEAAFDRKDALMRHERNDRTHLVKQAQPGAKRPARKASQSDPEQPRRQSTRKRKSLLPSTADMYASEDEDDEDDDEHLNKRTRGELSPAQGGSLEGMLAHELVIDPQLAVDEDYEAPNAGALGMETMQAVEAIQAALQQIEASADAEQGRAA